MSCDEGSGILFGLGRFLEQMLVFVSFSLGAALSKIHAWVSRP